MNSHVDRVLLHEVCWPVRDHDVAQQRHNHSYLYICRRGLRVKELQRLGTMACVDQSDLVRI